MNPMTSNEHSETLYTSMWERIQTFPLAQFVTEENFRVWFDQMIKIGRQDDIEFCVNYGKNFSGSKSYALVAEYQNILAWNIQEQSIFTNAKDVLETLFFVADAQPLNPDLIRGLRNEQFAQEEYEKYLNDTYPQSEGFSVSRRADMMLALTNFNSETYEWFSGSPDDVFEVTRNDAPFKVILADYKAPRPKNINNTIQNEYRHQLHHYDLGFDLINAEIGDIYPKITHLELVKYNVIDQSITVLPMPKDEEYKSMIVEACDMWWSRFALKGAIPPLQNAFEPIITPSALGEMTSTVLNKVRIDNPDFTIPKDVEKQLNAIPTALYDFSIVKALANEADNIASEIREVASEGINLLLESSAKIPKSGVIALGGAEIKWQDKRRLIPEIVLEAAKNLNIDISEHATTTYNTENVMKSILAKIKEDELDLPLSHCYETSRAVSIGLSRKRTGPAYDFVQQIKSATHMNINKLIESASGFYTQNVIQQEEDSKKRAAYQARSVQTAEYIIESLKEESRSKRTPIPREQEQYLQSPPEEGSVCFINSDGVIIDVKTGEIIGSVSNFDDGNNIDIKNHPSNRLHNSDNSNSTLLDETKVELPDSDSKNGSRSVDNTTDTSPKRGGRKIVLGEIKLTASSFNEGKRIAEQESKLTKLHETGLNVLLKNNSINPDGITQLIESDEIELRAGTAKKNT